MFDCALAPGTPALLSPAAEIAAHHPENGPGQLKLLRNRGVPEARIVRGIAKPFSIPRAFR